VRQAGVYQVFMDLVKHCALARVAPLHGGPAMLLTLCGDTGRHATGPVIQQ